MTPDVGLVFGVLVVAAFLFASQRRLFVIQVPALSELAGDRLLVEGSIDPLSELSGRPHLEVADEPLEVGDLTAGDIEVAAVRLAEGSTLIGQTLRGFGFRQRFGGNVVVVWRGDEARHSSLADLVFEPGDSILVQCSHAQLEELRQSPDFEVPPEGAVPVESLAERLLVVRSPSHPRPC